METKDKITLDETAKSVTSWMCENGPWDWLSDGIQFMSPNFRAKHYSALRASLDVVRKVEEALYEEAEIPWGYYRKNLIKLTEHLLLADPETRLRAIYRTLKEAGEI